MVNITKKDERPGVQSHEAQRSPLSLIDKFFDDAFFDPLAALSPGLLRRQFANMSGNFPKVDVSETDTAIKVVANVPGIEPDKINIEVGEDYLSLSGRIDKKSEEKDQTGKVYRYEREYGEFRREFSLPSRVNKDGIVAKAKNGVLTITLPKTEDERRTKVKVEVEK